MDYFKHPNPKVLNQFRLSHISQRIIKFLLSFSLLFVLFSLVPLLLKSFMPFLTQFITYTINKSYMFLLCNGLLAFIAKNSGLTIGYSPNKHQNKELTTDKEKSGGSEFKVSEAAASIDLEIKYQQEEEEEEKSLMIEGQEDGPSDTQEGEQEGNALTIIDEDEHAADDIEELNKKCEDFIRKMKAAFCSEPRAYYNFDFDNQKSLVAV